MTWKELKEFVERQGVKDDTIVVYIDISYPSNENTPVIEMENEIDKGKPCGRFYMVDSI